MQINLLHFFVEPRLYGFTNFYGAAKKRKAFNEASTNDAKNELVPQLVSSCTVMQSIKTPSKTHRHKHAIDCAHKSAS
jgi:hypothetical protein